MTLRHQRSVAPEGEITARRRRLAAGAADPFLADRRVSASTCASCSSTSRTSRRTPEKVLGADDDHVIVVAAIRGRTRDGATIENRSVWIYKLRGGQMVSAESYADTAQVARNALGSARILTTLSRRRRHPRLRAAVRPALPARSPRSSATATS